MKNLLNNVLHWFAKLLTKQVKISPEETQAAVKQSEEIAQQISEWMGTEEREKIGFGQNCNSSWYLKETGNKKASYPFDWIFTTPDFIDDMLSDNFQKLLDKNLLIPHGLDAGNEHYHEWLFGHRNPAKSDEDYQFFKRCVARWNKLMQTQKSVLFVTVVLNEYNKRTRWRDGFTKYFSLPKNQCLSDFESMINKVLTINPNCKFLFIEQYTEQPFELTVKQQNQNSFWIKFCAFDKNTGVQYLNDVDDSVMKNIYNGLNSSSKP